MIRDFRTLDPWNRAFYQSFDADTGEPLTLLFYHDDETLLTGRHLMKDGRLVTDPKTGRVCSTWEFRRVRFEEIVPPTAIYQLAYEGPTIRLPGKPESAIVPGPPSFVDNNNPKFSIEWPAVVETTKPCGKCGEPFPLSMLNDHADQYRRRSLCPPCLDVATSPPPT